MCSLLRIKNNIFFFIQNCERHFFLMMSYLRRRRPVGDCTCRFDSVVITIYEKKFGEGIV